MLDSQVMTGGSVSVRVWSQVMTLFADPVEPQSMSLQSLQLSLSLLVNNLFADSRPCSVSTVTYCLPL